MKKLSNVFIIKLILLVLVIIIVGFIIYKKSTPAPEQFVVKTKSNIEIPQPSAEVNDLPEGYKARAETNERREEKLQETQAICDAVENEDLEGVKSALEKGADPNEYCLTENFFGARRTILVLAIEKENYELSKLLLKSGADPNVMGYETGIGYIYPLDAAAEKSNIELIDLLLDNGADININVPVLLEVAGPKKEIVKHLFERGVKSAEEIYLPWFVNDKPFAEYLLSKGAKPVVYGVENIEDIKFMISKGADVNQADINKYIEKRQIDIIDLLVENGLTLTPIQQDRLIKIKNEAKK